MGGDSFCGDDEYRDLCAAPKVFAVGRSLGVGICGHVRAEIAFSEAITSFVKGRRTLSEKTLIATLPPHLAEVMAPVLNAAREVDNCSYLLAVKGGIFKVEADLGIWRVRRHFAGVGTASSIALAAIAMAAPTPPATVAEATDIVLRALAVAEQLTPVVMRPFLTLCVPEVK